MKSIKQLLFIGTFLLSTALLSQESTPPLLQFDSLSGEQLWNKILTENKGKVIYGDLCGTWCSGCIIDFGKSDSIHQVYESKELAFIYLWIRSTPDKAAELIANNSIAGQHILITREQEVYFEKKVENFGKHPYYFLVDQQSQIYYVDAPKPWQKVIYKHLDKLLAE